MVLKYLQTVKKRAPKLATTMARQQQQARCSIFIICLSLVGQGILEKELQTVQMELKRLMVDSSSTRSAVNNTQQKQSTHEHDRNNEPDALYLSAVYL